MLWKRRTVATEAGNPCGGSEADPAARGLSCDQPALNSVFGTVIERGWIGNIRRMRQYGWLWSTAAVAIKISGLIAIFLNIRYDWKHHVNTVSSATLSRSAITSDNIVQGFAYAPTSRKVIRTIRKHLADDLSDYTFVDFGCGKGKVLLLASNYNFKKIIGVEYSSYLSEIAKDNINSYVNSKQECHNIQCLHVDAIDFAIPEGPCVLYFFAPFSNEILSTIMNNVETALDANPREIVICYTDDTEVQALRASRNNDDRATADCEHHPINGAVDIFERHGFTCRIKRTVVGFDLGAEPNLEYVIYELKPSAGSGAECRFHAQP
jgi:SAM-dependent methyltransferase